MISLIRRIFCLVLLFISFLANAEFIQNQYLYQELSGVSANEVMKGVYRTEDGLLWIATDLGVLTYDGSQTITHTQGLLSLYTKQILSDPDGNLLVVSDLGIQRIARENDSVKFVPYAYQSIDLSAGLSYPKEAFFDSKGNLWIGESDAIFCIVGGESFRFKFGNNFNYHRSFLFSEDAFGHIWAASNNGQVMKWSESKHDFELLALDVSVSGYTGMATVQGDRIVIGGVEGIVILKVDSDQNILDQAEFTDVNAVSAVKQIDHQLLVGTWNNGLYLLDYDRGTIRWESVANVGFNDVIGFHYDQSLREIWVAGSENIGSLKVPAFSSVGVTGKYRIEDFVEYEDALLFTTGEELYLQEVISSKKTLLLKPKGLFLTAIGKFENQVFIGDNKGHIYLLDTATDVEMHSLLIGEPSLYPITDFSVIDGKMWVAGSADGVMTYEDGEFIAHGLPVANVVKKNTDGKIYGAGNGNSLFFQYYNPDAGKFESVNIEGAIIPENIKVEDIAFGENGTIYLATSNGLYFLTPTTGGFEAEQLAFADGKYDKSCRALLLLDDVLWVGTNEGIFRKEGESEVQFTSVNGLPSDLIKQRGLTLFGEQIAVATARGLALLDYPNLKIATTAKPVISQLLVNDESKISSVLAEAIPYHSDLSLSFQSVVFPPENVIYQTRINGINEEWNTPTTNNTLSLFELSAGEYEIEIRAKSIGALWSEPLKIPFVVAKPWYLTWWAFLILVVFAIQVVIISNKIYHLALIRQKKRLKLLVAKGIEEIEKQKNEIIEQQNHIISQKEELLEKNEAVFKAKQALSDADLKYLQLQEQQLKDQVDYRNKQITTHALNILQKNETLMELKTKLESVVKSMDKTSGAEIKKTIRYIDDSFRQDKDWEDFKLYFEQIYTGFYAKLKAKCPDLTQQDLKHCALIRLNLSIQECASILGISPESVKVSRTRIRKKINLDGKKGLSEFILSL